MKHGLKQILFLICICLYIFNPTNVKAESKTTVIASGVSGNTYNGTVLTSSRYFLDESSDYIYADLSTSSTGSSKQYNTSSSSWTKTGSAYSTLTVSITGVKANGETGLMSRLSKSSNGATTNGGYYYFTDSDKAAYSNFYITVSASVSPCNPGYEDGGLGAYWANSYAYSSWSVNSIVLSERDLAPQFSSDLPSEKAYNYKDAVNLSVTTTNTKSSGGYKWYKNGELYQTTDTGTLNLGVQNGLSLNGSTFYVVIESDSGLTAQSTSCILKANISTFTPKCSGNLT